LLHEKEKKNYVKVNGETENGRTNWRALRKGQKKKTRGGDPGPRVNKAGGGKRGKRKKSVQGLKRGQEEGYKKGTIKKSETKIARGEGHEKKKGTRTAWCGGKRPSA